MRIKEKGRHPKAKENVKSKEISNFDGLNVNESEKLNFFIET